MGAGDLNVKKSWHPRLQKNQEKVWQQEQEAEAERKKLEELRKEREQERQMQELQRLHEAAGGKKRAERVEWMYATPAASSGPSEAELEDYLLGKKRVDKLLQNNETPMLAQAAAPAASEAPDANARDMAIKIREDPLFAIKKQEQAMYEMLMKDPTRMRQIRARYGMTPTPSAKAAASPYRPRPVDRPREERYRDKLGAADSRAGHRGRSSHRDDDEHARRHRERRYEEDRERRHRSRAEEDRERRHRDRSDRYGERSRDERSARHRDDRSGDRSDRHRSDHPDRRRSDYTERDSRHKDRYDERRDHSASYRNEPSREWTDDRQRPTDHAASPRHESPRPPKRPRTYDDVRSPARDVSPPRSAPDTRSYRTERRSPPRRTDPAAREAQLKEMMQNAKSMAAEREARLHQAATEEQQVHDDEARQREASRRQGSWAPAHRAGQAAFLRDHQKELWGGESSTMDLHERLRRGRHALQPMREE